MFEFNLQSSRHMREVDDSHGVYSFVPILTKSYIDAQYYINTQNVSIPLYL